ncbi:glucosamine-6-phosphate deaminase [[Phormidium] sp. ETS-05]|uniref:glucosamine-6-phosphate deaminase n=1 Tax=[Phormidium] sp. ETS-05 TaxID=222819 RepID=UPI0018EEFF34|nr:glucosamine-6-phosphate deaminase [[Phormidium] sp. ETS-05]
MPSHTISVHSLSVQLSDNSAQLAKTAAAQAATYLQEVISRQGKAAVLLATGNSQIEFLQALISWGELDWSQITCFHLDEFLGIDGEHPGSFRRYLWERVASRVQPRAFHYICGDTLQPLDECDRYSQLLQAQPIDLALLGLGSNGHIAFNEPSVADFHDPKTVKIVKLETSTRLAQMNGNHFPHLEAVPLYAFTLTIPAITAAKKIFCLAPGKNKAEPVRAMLTSEVRTSFPASLLRTLPQTTLFLDKDAASLI